MHFSRLSLFICTLKSMNYLSFQTAFHAPTGNGSLSSSPLRRRPFFSVFPRQVPHPLHNYNPFWPNLIPVHYLYYKSPAHSQPPTQRLFLSISVTKSTRAMSVFNFEFSADTSAFPFIECVPLFGIQFSSSHSLIKIESKLNLCHRHHPCAIFPSVSSNTAPPSSGIYGGLTEILLRLFYALFSVFNLF